MDRHSRRRSRSRESVGSRSSRLRAYSGELRNRSPRRRSRSRSHSRRSRRSRSRDRYRHRGKRSAGRHSRSSSSSSSGSSSSASSKTRRKKRKEGGAKLAPDLLKARVFVGNLPFQQFTEDDLRTLLDPRGNVTSVVCFPDRGYAFLQYKTEADALTAVEEVKGSIWKGRNIDVKMALQGRRERDSYGRRSPPASAGGAGRIARDRSPLRDPYRDPRDRDPYRDIRDRDPLPSLRRDDPYYDDPYRRPLPPDDPYLDRLREDRYRGLPPPRHDLYADPYRDVPPPRPLPPPECTVLLTAEPVRPYGEVIIRRIKTQGLVASIAVLPEDRTIPQALDDMNRRGTLFAVVITAQNEIHSSVTLNILHGQPQEHRNMPLDDAMTLIARSYDRYVQSVREKAAVTPVAAGSRSGSAPFLAPEPGISYLLNLLADNRQLTITELDKVIAYLTERRNKLRVDVPSTTEPPSAVAPVRQPIKDERDVATSEAKQQEAAALQQRQDLQAKILSLFNGDSSKAGPTMADALMSLQGGAGQGLTSSLQNTGVAAAPPTGNPSGSTALINFDNPSVQKALDSLIQNPQVLQNIASVSAPTSVLNSPHQVGIGGQAGHGQPGIAHTALTTGSRPQLYSSPGQGQGSSLLGDYSSSVARQGGHLVRHHQPY